MVSAFTGHTRVGVTIAVYSVCAVLLLAYVSVQIYAGVLRQEISALKQERGEVREAMNKLTGEYVSLSSRSRIADYCENKLGMVRVEGESFEVIAVKDAPGDAPPVALTEIQDAIPSANRYTYRQTDENPGQ
jgi:cell division protein FtsL